MSSALAAFLAASNAGPLPIKVLEDVFTDGFGMFRTEISPLAEIVVVHDGSDVGRRDAEAYERLLPHAPIMVRLLREALDAWADQFDGPDDEEQSICATDLLEWFAGWRQQVRDALTNRSAAS